MPKAVIENPVLNSPYDEPTRHFDFDEDGITDRVVDSRRISSYFVPIPKPKKKGKQLELETEWTADRIEEWRPSDHARLQNRYVPISDAAITRSRFIDRLSAVPRLNWRKTGSIPVSATNSS